MNRTDRAFVERRLHDALGQLVTATSRLRALGEDTYAANIEQATVALYEALHDTRIALREDQHSESRRR